MNPLEKMSDLELAEILNQTWSNLNQMQANLQAINAEMLKRKEPKKDDKSK